MKFGGLHETGCSVARLSLSLLLRWSGPSLFQTDTPIVPDRPPEDKHRERVVANAFRFFDDHCILRITRTMEERWRAHVKDRKTYKNNEQDLADINEFYSRIARGKRPQPLAVFDCKPPPGTRTN